MYKFRARNPFNEEYIYSDDDDVFIKHEKKNNILAMYQRDKKFGGYDRVSQAFQFTGLYTNVEGTEPKEIYDKSEVIFTAENYIDKQGVVEMEEGMWVVGINDLEAIPLSDILQYGCIDIL